MVAQQLPPPHLSSFQTTIAHSQDSSGSTSTQTQRALELLLDLCSSKAMYAGRLAPTGTKSLALSLITPPRPLRCHLAFPGGSGSFCTASFAAAAPCVAAAVPSHSLEGRRSQPRSQHQSQLQAWWKKSSQWKTRPHQW